MRVACAGRLGSFTVRQSSCRASGVASVVKHASSATTSPAPCWCGAVWLRLRDRPPDLSTQVKHEVPSDFLRRQLKNPSVRMALAEVLSTWQCFAQGADINKQKGGTMLETTQSPGKPFRHLAKHQLGRTRRRGAGVCLRPGSTWLQARHEPGDHRQ